MSPDKLKRIKENLRSFRFETAFPLMLEAVEELAAACKNMEPQEMNGIMLMTTEAMENKDVIRLCDIAEYILYPQLMNTNEGGMPTL